LDSEILSKPEIWILASSIRVGGKRELEGRLATWENEDNKTQLADNNQTKYNKNRDV